MASSEAGYPMADTPHSVATPVTPRGHGFPSSPSARPQGPPSESNLDPSERGDGFMDDERPESSRPTDARHVQKVRDKLGDLVQRNFEKFIEEFQDESQAAATPSAQGSSAIPTFKYYVQLIHVMSNKSLSTLYIDFRHLQTWNDGALADAIFTNYYRCLPYLTSGLHNMIAKYEPKYFRDHRQPTASSKLATSAASQFSSEDDVDAPHNKNENQQTDKLFAIAIYNVPLVTRLRSLRSGNIGQLLSICGTVTRTSEVRPELSLATFTCENCRTVVPNVEQTFRYTEPTQCPNETCNNRIAWALDIRRSTFIDWQKVRVQENSAEIPTGSMPRTMDIILRGEMVDRAKAGEKCIFTGTLIVVPDVSQLALPGSKPMSVRDDRGPNARGDDAGGSGISGLKALGVRDLTYRMAFLANMVTPDITGQSSDTSATDVVNALLAQDQAIEGDDEVTNAQRAVTATMSEAEITEMSKMAHDPEIYTKLVKSMAPMVYGHEYVKKGLLLQLVSGVHKQTAEGMQLRGDINVCIVGDPSTSKSQFLKYVCSFAPRAVYTSGKASSAAGLTAAVVKDEETGEFTIEAGALMLADNGICAIDEFDKMDIADQVAIHEAMEQQTISIAKAGIQATLNARTSILAAANPVGGRYNRKTSLRANINMSAPIMSRFDLFFVVLDECNEQIDRHLAEHIVSIHQLRDEAVEPIFSTEQLQRYIRYARTFRPVFTPEAQELLVEKYKELRADDVQGGIGKNSYRITVRQLESMIRLSEAIAKVNCEPTINEDMVVEAYTLLRSSIISVEYDDVEIDEEEAETQEDASTLLRAASQAHGDTAMEEDPSTEQRERRKLTITYEKYLKMLNAFVGRIKDDESDSGDGVEGNELISWYLESVESELDGPEAHDHEQALAKMVLKKMVKENILMALRGEGLQEEGVASSSAAVGDVIYVIHPNCAIEEV